MNWADREIERLEDDLDNGEITQAEFQQYQSEIHREIEQEAEDAAEAARYDVLGY